MNRNILTVIDVVWSVISALLFLSGVLWYPIFDLVIGLFGAAVLALVLGFWFGGFARLSGTLAVAIANAAVLAGFLSYSAVFLLFSGNHGASTVSFYAGAIGLMFGYAALVGSIMRVLVRRWSKVA
ncbi:MAG TPA: hypothetical protein VFR68_08080 [Candidatus Dormibacteraeota bacterium]|nr:hypothetical protein [Candidatus Dormibacteraeota bacterium]